MNRGWRPCWKSARRRRRRKWWRYESGDTDPPAPSPIFGCSTPPKEQVCWSMSCVSYRTVAGFFVIFIIVRGRGACFAEQAAVRSEVYCLNSSVVGYFLPSTRYFCTLACVGTELQRPTTVSIVLFVRCHDPDLSATLLSTPFPTHFHSWRTVLRTRA